MRKIIFAILAFFALAVTGMAQEETSVRCKFSAEKIIEGTKGLSLTYDPAGTVLANETDIKCVMYFLQNRQWRAYDVDVRQVEGKWIGTFDVPADAALMTCKFTAGNPLKVKDGLKTDWGWPATYSSFVLDKKQQNKPGAMVAWGLLRQKYGRNSLPGMLEDSLAAPIENDVVRFWHNQEYRAHHEEQLNSWRTLIGVMDVRNPEKKQMLKENMLFYLNNKKTKFKDQQLADMYDIATRTLADLDFAKQIKEKEQKLFKHGIIERDEEMMRVMNHIAKEKADGLPEFYKFMKTYPTEKFRDVHTFMTDLQYRNIFRSGIYTLIMMKDDYSNLVKYIHDIPYTELTTTHWHIADSPFSNGHATAEKVLPWSRLIIKEMKERPRLEADQLIYSPREYEERIVLSHTMAWEAHARILTACGEYKEAMEYASVVYPFYEANNNEFATMWIKLLKENGRAGEVPAYIEKCVYTNITSQEMIDELKADYLSKNPQGNFDAYMTSLKNKTAADAQRQHMIESLINVPIELCELDKLGGGKVNLADKKGKIIFLDFWATWCAPCKASLPGGQMAVDRYKDDPDVEFYFVDTQETNKNFREKVSDYIKEKGFTFNVLFDEGEAGKQSKLYDKIARTMHTSGIPYKVIIGKDGNLRWSMSGYGGSPTGFADEVQYVIDYLKNN